MKALLGKVATIAVVLLAIWLMYGHTTPAAQQPAVHATTNHTTGENGQSGGDK